MPDIQPIETDYDWDSDPPKLIFPERPPFDGKPVWLVTEMGIVQGRWVRERKYTETLGGINWTETEGDFWLCFGDQFAMELEQPLGWFPLEQMVIPQ